MKNLKYLYIYIYDDDETFIKVEVLHLFRCYTHTHMPPSSTFRQNIGPAAMLQWGRGRCDAATLRRCDAAMLQRFDAATLPSQSDAVTLSFQDPLKLKSHSMYGSEGVADLNPFEDQLKLISHPTY